MTIETSGMNELAIKEYLSLHRQATATEIAEALHARQAAVKGSISSLVRAGVVHRVGEVVRHRTNGGDKTIAMWALVCRPVAGCAPIDLAEIMGAVVRSPAPKTARVVRVEDHGHRHAALRPVDAWTGYGQ